MKKRIAKIILSLILLVSILPINQTQAENMSFLWPSTSNALITQAFIAGDHYGLDIDVPGSGYHEGVPIYASYDGTVRVSTMGSPGNFGGYGNVIVIKHNIGGDTYETLYAHLDSRIVSVGKIVKQGDLIGYMGATGTVSPAGPAGQHLHFELHNGTWNASKSNAINPKPYLVDTIPVPSQPNAYKVYARSADKDGYSKEEWEFSTLEAAQKEMKKYNYTSIVRLSDGLEIETNNTPKDIKVYHYNQTKDGKFSYAEFSTVAAASAFIDRYKNMVVIDTETWKQRDWNVLNTQMYGAFNGSNGEEMHFGVPTAARDYLKTKGYANSIILDKHPLFSTPKSYPTVEWESNPSLPKKYLVTNGTIQQSYSIYTAAVYAKNRIEGSELIIQ